MPQRSAGLLMFRRRNGTTEVLLVHMGGPFWAKKDDGAWSMPKGLHEASEDALAAARREFEEETGCVPKGPFVALGTFRQPSGKQLSAWAMEGEFDLSTFKSNMFTMEWPPKSGRMAAFPEADRAGWFDQEQALVKVTKGQRSILKALFERLELPRQA
ncbi:NUDIX domain-containing protein [Bradyrhizobium sp.]|uniref:NUDIX domain-containing protein n=1 Tax=Bradyrhizobium sp. TaxID=376 RepID=UPI001DB2376F|nr:NUDIX domain-containing protein [Bradyrhizobium sp.]MBV8700044.1 NUDIX domain-containing protein [Bradyrhizobium sp.]MBV8916694.1 NUDIX domain-containing protein [Bradyrhizobium sp.]